MSTFKDTALGYIEVLVSAFSLLMCLLSIFYLIPNYIEVYSSSWPTPQTFPYTTCTIHAFLCTIWLVNSLFGRDIKAQSAEIIKQGVTLNAIVILLCFLIYHIGYLVGATVAVGSLIMLIKGPRYWKHAVFGAIIISLVYYVFFVYVMQISLPEGLLI